MAAAEYNLDSKKLEAEIFWKVRERVASEIASGCCAGGGRRRRPHRSRPRLVGSIEPAEVFGEGRVAADLLGWDGLVVLNEAGKLVAVDARGTRRTVRLPDEEIRRALGRGLSAATDLIVTREERLWLLDTAGRRLLSFRVLSE